LHLVIGDPNKEALDPDKLAKGVVPYIKNNVDKAALYPIYDFFVRYVRKLHSDKYIKSTLKNNRGQSFLELIGPSDVAYVITLLKNSIEVWKHEPPSKVAETDGETVEEVEAAAPGTSAVPKPLYTRGAHVKRTFGKTAWSDEGMEYYKATLETWKKMFDRRSTFFNVLSSGWDEWLETSARVLNPNGWTRKDLQSLLRTIPEGSSWKDGERAEGKAAKITEISYESEDEGGPLIGFGQVVGGTSRGHSESVELEEEYATNNDDMDDNNNMGLGKASTTHQEDSGNDDDHEDDGNEEEDAREDDPASDEEHPVIDITRKRRSQKDKSPPSKQPPSKKPRGAKRAKK
jgi:hypothetical protein